MPYHHIRTEIMLLGLKNSMYQRLLELIINNHFNGTSLGLFALVFNTTIDDLRSLNPNVYTNDFIAYLLEHLNRISNSNNIGTTITPMITKLMMINSETNTQHYLIRILTDSIDTFLLNNDDTNTIKNRMEGAAAGLLILIKHNNTNTADESIVLAFVTLCHKLNYNNTSNSNATDDIIGLALGLLLQPILELSKKNRNTHTTTIFFFFLTLALKKFEMLWQQKGIINIILIPSTNTNT